MSLRTLIRGGKMACLRRHSHRQIAWWIRFNELNRGSVERQPNRFLGAHLPSRESRVLRKLNKRYNDSDSPQRKTHPKMEDIDFWSISMKTVTSDLPVPTSTIIQYNRSLWFVLDFFFLLEYGFSSIYPSSLLLSSFSRVFRSDLLTFFFAFLYVI